MGLVEHLMQTRTPLELAKELAQTAKENADLRREIVGLEVELFWLRDARTKLTATDEEIKQVVDTMSLQRDDLSGKYLISPVKLCAVVRAIQQIRKH